VAALAAGSPAAIDWLMLRGARLERQDLRLEGGHSRNRIVHSGDDASGAEVHRALLAALLASPVEVLGYAAALDLVKREDGGAAGLTVLDRDLGAGVVSAPAVVIAAGGLGQAFATTSNQAGATGDGIALAARAGAVLRDLEFVQFHPTVLWQAGASGQRPLITEALRGAGAVLRDASGAPVMAGRHPLGDLAPRDIVAAAIHEVITAQDSRHVWLDATALGSRELEDGFPTVTKACREQGVDPVTDYIPVAPGAHYSCGGIAADLRGRTSIPGLYAVGEAASTGVHGANRLASNSLVEAVIMGRNAGRDVLSMIASVFPGNGTEIDSRSWRFSAFTGSRAALAEAMSRHAGVLRDQRGLTELLRMMQSARLVRREGNDVDLGLAEATNLHAVSVLIAAAALRRTESRGCHRRRDAAATCQEAWHTLMRWTPDGVEIRRMPAGSIR
jgi:L-aspartate oxidase